MQRSIKIIALISRAMLLRFAWRYFKGKKSTQAIQVISWVSVLAMAVGTAALLIVLSVFNGFEFFIKDLYSNFYPAIKITSNSAKTFSVDSKLLYNIGQLKGIEAISSTLEEKVLLAHENNQLVVTIKGIDSSYNRVTNISDKVLGGELNLNVDGNYPNVLLGVGLSNRLGANEETHLPINAYSFKSTTGSSFLNPSDAYNSQLFAVSGVYGLQDDIDNKYAFAPLEIVQSLTDKNGLLSSIEIKLLNYKEANNTKLAIEKLLKPSQHLVVETRYEQNKTLNFILKTERWFVFAFLSFILFIASFNIIGALSMLVIEKEKDITILKAMGMKSNSIQGIFLSTGILLSLIGASIGCIFAFLVCLIQQEFGIVKLGGNGSFLVDAYPVKMQLTDFIMVIAVVLFISVIASILPALKAGKRGNAFATK